MITKEELIKFISNIGYANKWYGVSDSMDTNYCNDIIQFSDDTQLIAIYAYENSYGDLAFIGYANKGYSEGIVTYGEIAIILSDVIDMSLGIDSFDELSLDNLEDLLEKINKN